LKAVLFAVIGPVVVLAVATALFLAAAAVIAPLVPLLFVVGVVWLVLRLVRRPAAVS
jgi:hypothetical protein